MGNSTISFLIGIASSIVAYFVLKIPLVKLINMVVKEVDIRGEWKTTISENNKTYHENVIVNQMGRKVWGTINLHDSEMGDIKYRFSGTFKNLHLICTFETIDKSNFEMGTIILKKKTNKLVGKSIAMAKFNNEKDDIISSDYIWTKVKK